MEEITQSSHVKFKRELGLFSAINLILSIMIGSGIFISSASALSYAGSSGLCLIVWTVSGVVSFLGALGYAELGILVPRSGSDYAFLIRAFGPLHKFWGPLPAFLNAWSVIVLIRPAEVTVILLTFSKYLCQPIFKALCMEDQNNNWIEKLIALLALGIITFINMNSVKLYVKMQNVFGFCKVAACLVVIGGGIYSISKGRYGELVNGFQGTSSSPKNIALAFYSGLWAYDGWSLITSISEEIKRPEKNILRSILVAVPLVTALYVFMNVAYLSVLTYDEMTSATAVAVAFGDKIHTSFSIIIPIGVAISTFGCALSLQFSACRVCNVASQDGYVPEGLSFIHHEKLTPGPAVVVQALICLLMIFIGSIDQLIEFASFLLWIFYGLSMVALLVLRKTARNEERPYRVPTVIPIFIIIVSLFLTITPIALQPSPYYLIILAFLLIDTLLYYILVYRSNSPKALMGKLTYLVQVLFEAVPLKKD